MTRRVVDVSKLPTFAFGSRSLMWWGTVSIMIVEGSMFALALISYFYLRGQNATWPPGSTPLPGWTLGTLNTLVLLVSIWPNQRLKKSAEKLDLEGVRRGLLLSVGFALIFLLIRAFEFGQLNVAWNDNAYGSIVWVLLGLHTTHLLTDAYDTGVLSAMSWTTPVDGRRFVDVSENCEYWDFVVAAWLPIWFVIYIYPRF